MAIDRLLKWLDESSCNFMAVATMRRELDKAGFTALDPSADWHLQPGGRYYMVRNDSAIMAWICGTSPLAETGARIIAAHSDSPCFKIKPNAEIIGDGGVICLNVEKYGGGIMYTWFDRPLSISGRVMTAAPDPLQPRTHLVDPVSYKH
ncbi:MAG: M18 family aminopeptidase, partial [Muribaculaceae bacterium]|nr:M18 family aminopeptidase [Muribaculaceae bacterium]